MTKVFVNYRREDTRSDAARIHDRLVTAFGKTNVFMDVDNLLAGQRFDHERAKALEDCDVFLAIIGSRWQEILSDRTKRGGRDYVREEIAQALARGILVIPVLIDRTPLPSEGSLPADLSALVMHQKHDVSHERFGRDVTDLIEGIRASRRARPRADKGARSSRFSSALVPVAVVTLLTAAAVYWFNAREHSTISPSANQRVTPAEIRGTNQTRELGQKPAGATTTALAVQEQPAVALPRQEIIRVAVAGPLTGGSAAFGAQLKAGVEQAVSDIHSLGGILGHRISLIVADDRADPREGVQVAQKLVTEGVKFVVGHFNSGITIPASLVYSENDVLAITPSATNPCVTDRKFVPCLDQRTFSHLLMFRTCGRDDQQGILAGTYIAKKFAGKKVAIIHDKTTYGQGVAVDTRKAMNAKGAKEVMFEGVNKDDKDFSALVSKTKASGADLIYWGGLHDTGGLILRQMRDQRVKATFMGADGITSDEFAVIAGPGAEGTLMTYGPDPRKRPEAKAVVEKFRAKKFEPEAYTLYSYAAMQVLKQAAEAEKSIEPKKVANRIYSGMKFKTVIGELSYDKKGDVTRLDYVMYVWKKDASGKITYVELE